MSQCCHDRTHTAGRWPSPGTGIWWEEGTHCNTKQVERTALRKLTISWGGSDLLESTPWASSNDQIWVIQVQYMQAHNIILYTTNNLNCYTQKVICTHLDSRIPRSSDQNIVFPCQTSDRGMMAVCWMHHRSTVNAVQVPRGWQCVHVHVCDCVHQWCKCWKIVFARFTHTLLSQEPTSRDLESGSTANDDRGWVSE